MKTALPIAILAFILPAEAGAAQGLTPDSVNGAEIEAIARDQPQQGKDNPDPAIVRLQVLLDRAGVSPGVVDGFKGENVTKAVSGFEAMNGLPVDGKLDADVISRLNDQKPAVASYRISDDDARDLVASIPEDYGEKAKMQRLGYTSVVEKLSERFHMDPNLLNALNPAAQFLPGETIWVVSPGAPRQGRVKRIEANKRTGQVLAYAEDGSLLAVYPATIGSKDNPAPSGKHKIKGVAKMPEYRYDPRLNFQQGKNDKVLMIPAGPNNPVGSVWIDLTEPTYGIHGTPEPELIDKVGSHGCVRLTNWDVEELADMVKPGVIVDFINKRSRNLK